MNKFIKLTRAYETYNDEIIYNNIYLNVEKIRIVRYLDLEQTRTYIEFNDEEGIEVKETLADVMNEIRKLEDE